MQTTLKNYLAGELLTIAMCWKLTLIDGKVMGFTDYDENLSIDNILYKSSSGFTASSIILNSNLKTDNLEIEGILNSDDIKEEDVLSGKYDFANVEIFLVNYKDLSQGTMNLHFGTFGKVTLNSGRFVVEIRGLAAKLERNMAELYSPACRAQFCDDRCKADAKKFSKISTVTKVIDERRFEDTNLTEIDGYYKHGVVKFFDSAAFEGVVKEYKNKVVTLFTSPPYQIFAGDKYSILAGCDKTFSMCKNKFNNTVNFRGEPYIPGLNLPSSTTFNIL
ncbi:DUF2163 domain-containing protein [Wolbachia endosymbiont of Atemnus politus]|uniref:DUF2163 domain-containing protein n=1 Tax=Wolbachia endosymbiont of Atemnus politus TaxID=2682840 RepID=UPI0015728C55|nr:DUF2163 domain-containing protein [Wolbachia endosymbiont of Atemnus politus]NSM56351.1 DUF2163 domain-containing protein [Wolbachia endosymbiont of Atemnus politus]NSX83039.1 DUF2163 domain-containing protein [Wolbachia endosymbiont of Atemnus politus]